MLDYQTIRSLMFKLDPETAHSVAEFFLKNYKLFSFAINLMARNNFVCDEKLTQEIDGITYINPVGLAAGFDKNATMFQSLPALGFGFVEIGTFTPLPQAGNEKPRLFRFPEQESLQNAMGFNNDGMHKIAQRVQKKYPFAIPLGINIGKNKITPADKAIDDYFKLVQKFSEIGDFFIVNVSSPNTPGLRDLQNESFIKELIEKIKPITNRPIYLKIAPDLHLDIANELIFAAVEAGASGIIANNTSNDYSLLENAKDFGGISGRVICEKSFEFFDEIASNFYGKTTLISVGGIDSADEAYKRIKAGASLVEIYTALIFNGPSLVKNINEGILKNLKRDGFNHISQAVGASR
ncbi:MAG: dihydroorotate dehydrogenase [Campylobacterota bacterium]|nr:dihydroorotate dehydrogenase [Campylobacterota bacterium]